MCSSRPMDTTPEPSSMACVSEADSKHVVSPIADLGRSKQSFSSSALSASPSSSSSRTAWSRCSPLSQQTCLRSCSSSCEWCCESFLSQMLTFSFLSIVPTTFVPLRFLSITSLIGIISTFSLLVVIIADGSIQQHSPGSLHQPMPTSAGPRWMRLPLSFGLMMSGVGSHRPFKGLKLTFLPCSSLVTPSSPHSSAT